MSETVPMTIIAHIHTELPEKFGIPRQSGLADALQGTLVFEPPFRQPAAFRGLEGYSHVWLIWQFSEAMNRPWTPTVRPPRLGGNTRMGVFATRSPFRPNPIGLSSVRLDAISWDDTLGPLIHVSGADLMDGTPIYDIKPYLAYTDAHPDAAGGFALQDTGDLLKIHFPPALLAQIPPQRRQALCQILAQDPRPGYHHDPQRIYGLAFAGFNIRFTINGDTLTVCEVSPDNSRHK